MAKTSSAIPRPAVDEVRELYVGRGLGCLEIGRMFERNAYTARGWLLATGITTRPRSSNAAVLVRCGQRSAFAGRKHRPEGIAKFMASPISVGLVPYPHGDLEELEAA